MALDDRITIRLPAELRGRVQRRANLRGTTLNEAIRQALHRDEEAQERLRMMRLSYPQRIPDLSAVPNGSESG
jgi:hypothetical protein